MQIVKKRPAGASESDYGYDGQIYKACEFDHPYPCTKILWSPDAQNSSSKDLLATTGDYLRIWNLTDDGTGQGTLVPKKEALLNNVSLFPTSFALLTSFFFHAKGVPFTSCFYFVHNFAPSLCHQNKNSEYCAPLTSFDWNEADPNIVG